MEKVDDIDINDLFAVTDYDEMDQFVIKTHYEALSRPSRTQETDYTLIFRACGKFSLNRLNDGAGAKPHDILEKSIKDPAMPSYMKGFVGHWSPDRLMGVYMTTGWEEIADKNGLLGLSGLQLNGKRHQLSEDSKGIYTNITLTDFCAALKWLDRQAISKKKLFLYANKEERHQLDKIIYIEGECVANGFIGKWEKKLLGIFVTNYGKTQLEIDYNNYILSVETSTKPKKITRYYFNLPNEDAEEAFQEVINASNTKYFFAGDYDLMDHICGTNYLIEGQAEFELFMRDIQLKIPTMATDRQVDKDYRLIQHGAQAGYIAYIINNELPHSTEQTPGVLLETVAGIEFPLAAVHKNKWYVIKTLKGYTEFFAKVLVSPKAKDRWINEQDCYEYLKSLKELFKGKLICFDKQGNIIPFG
jgi:hypothetical protein